MLSFVGWLLFFAALGIGAIFGLDALGWLPRNDAAGFVGLALGVLAIIGASFMALWD